MTFAFPYALLLLIALLLVLLWDMRHRREGQTRLMMPSTQAYLGVRPTLRARLVRLPRYLGFAAASLLIVALARPQTDAPLLPDEGEGIDIVLAMDISQSMLTKDMTPNRLETAKSIASEFVAARRADNIGLTIFGGDALTLCPLTTDHAALLSALNNVSTKPVENGSISSGTAIGMGLATATAHLCETSAPSKVVVLLTDGDNNTGAISPLSAADLAANQGVRVYTISIGSTTNELNQSVHDAVHEQVAMKEAADSIATSQQDVLQQIAARTGGKYFKASTASDLSAAYSDIDKMEKHKLIVQQDGARYEAYAPFALAALALLALSIVLKLTWLRRWP